MTRPADARLAGEAGADVVGAILVEGSRRFVSTRTAREIGEAAEVPLALVVSDLPVDSMVHAAREAGAAVLQLHGSEQPPVVRELRARGNWELWKAARVRTEQDILTAVDRYGSLVDLLLLDAWHPTLRGGTGTAFPWRALESVRNRLPPGSSLGVAGGLDPENVAEAVRRLRPGLVDVSSGVEVESQPGRKDPERMRAFVSAVRAAAGEAAE
ncbi:MAG: phosphoribosylanthranilate isomerase [Longimicrobiales bacterium]